MTSPSVDTNSNCLRTYNWSNTSSFSNSAQVWKTSGANQLALAIITIDKAASSSLSAVSVTDGTTTLTFALHDRIEGPSLAPNYGFETIEVWKCQCASQFNAAGATVTTAITSSGSIDNAVITLLSIQGLADIANPFDPNISTSVKSVNPDSTSRPPPTLTYTTTNASDLLLFISAGVQTTNSVNPSGWTQHLNTFNGGGSAFESQMISSKQVSSTQTSQTVQDASASSLASWAAMLLAFAGVSPVTDFLYPKVILY